MSGRKEGEIKITKKVLVGMGFCHSRDTFTKVFPRGAVLNTKNLLKAWNSGLEVEYFIKRLLPEDHGFVSDTSKQGEHVGGTRKTCPGCREYITEVSRILFEKLSTPGTVVFLGGEGVDEE